MTTALDIVDRALEIVQVKASGQSSSGEDSSLGLRVLSSLLDSLQLDPHATIGLEELTYTPTAGAQTITIGTAGNIVATMPVRIHKSSFMRLSGFDYRIWFADSFDEYTAKRDKTLQGYACSAYWMPSNSGLGTLYLYPAANGAQFRLWVDQEVIDGFATMTLATVLTLPAGYRWLLEYMLADKLALDYKIDPATAMQVKSEAAIAMRRIKRTNKRVPQMDMPMGNTTYDIASGSYV